MNLRLGCKSTLFFAICSTLSEFFCIFGVSLSLFFMKIANTKLTRLYPFFVAVAIYATISLLYFAPQLSGEVLVQGDIVQYRGMTQEILDTRETRGEDPQWTGSMFGGMPAYLINVSYPSQIIKRGFAFVTNILDAPASFMLFSMLSMWLMLVMMGCNGWVAIVGGAMYGLSTYFLLIIEAGHLTKMWALVYAPAMMGAIYVALRRGSLWSFPLTALLVSLEVGANHPQITYYFLMAAAALWLSELYFAWHEGAWREFVRRTSLLVVAGLLGVMSNLSPLWYTAQHTPDTMRGGSELSVSGGGGEKGLDLEYATAWSYGRVESLNMLIPDFVGRDSATPFSPSGEVAQSLASVGIDPSVAQQLPTYWGDQPFTAGATYLGAVVLFLACVGFGLSKGRERWWLVGVSVVMLLLAWGSNLMWFTELAFNILPGYNKVRTVSMTLVVLQWAAPLLATYALAQLWRGDIVPQRLLKVVAWSMGATAGVALVMVLFGGMLFDFGYGASFEMLLNVRLPESVASQVAEAMSSERVSIMRVDALRSVIYILFAAVVVLIYGWGRIPRWAMVAGVGLLAVVDLVGVDMRYFDYGTFTSPRNARIVASAASREILTDRGETGSREYRVMNLSVSPFNDATTSYFHRSVGGYHGAKLSRYQDIIDQYLSRVDSAVLDMLNTKYLISQRGEVVERPTALGGAWLVESLERVVTPHEQIAMLGEMPLNRVAVVTDREVGRDAFDADGEITMEEYAPHYQRYRYVSTTPSVAIFSEIYYPLGWKLYVDGEVAEYFRANYILRGAELPAGEHTIEWRFRAPAWGLVEGITLLASLLILASLIYVIVLVRREKREE